MVTVRNRCKLADLLRLATVTLDGEPLAVECPVASDVEGAFVDLGPSIRSLFGGGVRVGRDAEITLTFRWIVPTAASDE